MFEVCGLNREGVLERRLNIEELKIKRRLLLREVLTGSVVNRNREVLERSINKERGSIETGIYQREERN